MPTDLRAVPNRVSDRSTTLRDLAAVFFRHQKLFVVSFVVVLVIGMLWVILAPSYKAEMKILVRRGRIDPAITPTETAPLLDRGNLRRGTEFRGGTAKGRGHPEGSRDYHRVARRHLVACALNKR